jgi:GTP-binding protein EngB required for normal cell division
MSSSTTGESINDGLNHLLSDRSRETLDLIDDLRQIKNLDSDLPQIIVCGNQSSGKSSVLEAISRLSFPRDPGTCTKFATELRLRHGKSQTQSVGIQWADGRDSDNLKVVYSDFREDLASTVRKATDVMKKRHKESPRTFFKDVLQIEATDPKWPSLTLVDLPGIVHDSEEKVVHGIVEDYMKRTKTIILAVIDAYNDPETQQILELAKKHDPSGERTMGILTKPDRVEGTKAASKWIEIVRNGHPKYHFQLGWHVVRNSGEPDKEKNSAYEERDLTEITFFEGSQWSRVGEENYGINTLRNKLSTELETRTKAVLPVLYHTLRTKRDASCKRLKELGPVRHDKGSQLNYLLPVADQLTRLIQQAVASPVDPNSFEVDGKFLRVRLQLQYELFHARMETWGHSYSLTPADTGSLFVVDHEDNRIEVPAPELFKTVEELNEQKIKRAIESCQGQELKGTVNSAAVGKAFQELSKRWRSIATSHIVETYKLVYLFISKAVKHIAKDQHLGNKIMNLIVGPCMSDFYQSLRNKLDEILIPFEKFTPMTSSGYYSKEMAQNETSDSLQLTANIVCAYYSVCP